MAARYWVGGTGNWDAATTTHWSASSGGSGGASVPSSSDDVTFDASSGGGTVTITATQSVKSMTGGSHTGTVDFNGQTMTIGSLNWSGTGTRSLTLGSSNITITDTTGVTVWNIGTVTNLTLSAASSTITFTGVTAGMSGGSGKTYGTLIFSGSGNQAVNQTTICSTLTRTGTASKNDVFYIGSGITVTSALNLNGNSSTNRLLVACTTLGTQVTITTTGATVTATNTDFQDIALSVTKDFSAQTNIGDCGGNSGITFPASVSQYYGGASLNGSSLRLNNITASGCYVPDSAALSILGDMTLDIKCSLDDWTPSATMDLISKYITTGNQRSYILRVHTDGTLKLFISTDGTTTTTYTSSAATGLTDGSTKWIRVVFDADNGSSQSTAMFYMSDDGSSWTQLGTTQTSTVKTIYDSTAQFEIGSEASVSSSRLVGNVYRAIAYSDITQTTKVFDADFAAQSAGTTSFTESSVNAATVSLKTDGGNWSASAWTTRVPLPQDDVYLGNVFNASQTLVADMPRLGRSIDWTGATGTPAWALTSVANIFYGSITLISGMTLSQDRNINFSGRGTHTITSAGKQFPSSSANVYISSIGGTYTMQDAFSTGGSLTLQNGTFNANGFNVSARNFTGSTTTTRSLIMGSGTWTVTLGSGTPFNMTTTTGLTFSGELSTIIYSGSNTAGATFAGGGLTFGTFTNIVNGSTGALTITGSNSFYQFNFSDASNARSLLFTASTTTTIRNTNGFNIQGTSGKLMTIASVTAATHTLTSTQKQICNYLHLTNSLAGGGGPWYAGANSTDNGGNTGWIFTAAPITGGGLGTGSSRLQNRQSLQNLKSF